MIKNSRSVTSLAEDTATSPTMFEPQLTYYKDGTPVVMRWAGGERTGTTAGRIASFPYDYQVVRWTDGSTGNVAPHVLHRIEPTGADTADFDLDMLAHYTAKLLGLDWCAGSHGSDPTVEHSVAGITVTFEAAPGDEHGSDPIVLCGWVREDGLERTLFPEPSDTLARVAAMAAEAVRGLQEEELGVNRVDLLTERGEFGEPFRTLVWRNGVLVVGDPAGSSFEACTVAIHSLDAATADTQSHEWYTRVTTLGSDVPRAVRAYIENRATKYHAEDGKCLLCRPRRLAQLVKAEPTALHYAIGENVSRWVSDFALAASLYAHALTNGLIAPTEERPDALALLYPEQTEQYELLGEEWDVAIDSLHGLADGHLVHYDSEEPQRRFSGRGCWTVYDSDLPPGITVDEFRAAFKGDILAAAVAFRNKNIRSNR